MISINNTTTSIEALTMNYPPESIQYKVIRILSDSQNAYNYSSMNQLFFEADLRNSIITASRRLNSSYFSFKIFRKSTCNTNYWERTGEGGFLLKKNVLPTVAISDILTNSSEYGTECATAMVVVYYLALLEVFTEKRYNELFTDIYLMDWQHLDQRIGIQQYRYIKDFLPGDCRYFKNPDVDPLVPEWQGENTIDLGDGTYYGHGLGINTAEEIVDTLNRYRFEDANESAYLLESATRLNFKRLYSLTSN